MIVTTFEHAYLTQADFFHPNDFDWLLEQNFDGFNIERKNQQWRIKVSHYIGVIGLPSGAQLEILPKISQQQQIPPTRQWLQRMLSDIWQTLTPKALPTITHQHPINDQLPLTDWLQQQFWQLWQNYLPNQHYQRIEQNQSYLQGKLLLKQHLQHNAHQPHKFFHQTDEFIHDTACNRLIKATFHTLIATPKPLPLSQQWQVVQNILPTQYQATFSQAQQEMMALPAVIASHNLSFISFCYALLTLTQAAGQGQTHTLTLLINMQFAFEKWVTYNMRQRVGEADIHEQPTQALTADNRLMLKPDIWLRKDNKTIIADVKWKNIRQVSDISLADMYQLMTYANEFHTDEAWLIIPTLDKSLPQQPIMLANPKSTAFWLIPFCVGTASLHSD